MEPVSDMRRILKITPFIVLLVCSYYFYDWVSVQEQTERDKLLEVQPVFSARNISTRQYNSDGMLYGSIKAEEAEYFDSLDQTNFTHPIVTYSPALDKNNRDIEKLSSESNGTWKIEAETGSMTGSADTIFLRGNVIASSSGKNSIIREIRTSYLEIDLGTDEVRTPEEVHIIGNQFTNRGKKFKGQLASKYFELSEDCHATYTGFTQNK